MTEAMTTQKFRKRRHATVVDVAVEAGVAVGTVSRYLNGQAVRSANRAQIERAIESLGYMRNAVAASMKTEVRHIVGFLVPHISEFHAGLLEQISRRIRRTGRAVMSYCHDLDSRSFMEGIDFFRTHRVDAIILDGGVEVGDQLRRFAEEGLEIVLYDNDIPGLAADRVFVNHRQASRHAVEHLIQLGHTRVATICGDQGDTAGQLRLAGYLDAISSHDVPEDPDLIVEGGWTEVGGHEAMRRLFALEDGPTAVFSANYNMTIGALSWCHENAVRIPADVSIVSFDDVPAFRLHQPGITAIAQPIEGLAEAITTLLSARFGDTGIRAHRELTVNCHLTLRGSTGRCNPAKHQQKVASHSHGLT